MMKKFSIFLIVLMVPMAILISSFQVHPDRYLDPNVLNETEVLLKFLEGERNFINTEAAPALIPAAEVKQNLKNKSFHIIDIRSSSWFDYGHIKNANNVKTTDLLKYFENSIVPSDYEKIVLICYSGQSAAYFTSLLRLAGYDNVYSMDWGMSSWRVDFAEGTWLKNVSSDYSDKVVTAATEKNPKGNLPALSTGEVEAQKILRARLDLAFATPYKESIVKAADVFADPSAYYIIDYNDLDKYQVGHIPQAVHYQPKGSLHSSTDLMTLPADKKIVVYGTTGQDAAYAVAYLDVLGYDAGNLAYGANGFMHETVKDNKWGAFSKKEVNMYPVIE